MLFFIHVLTILITRMGKIKIKNLQKIKRINLKQWQNKLAKILKFLELKEESVSFVLGDNKFIKELNRKYLGRNSPTDVIAFPLSDDLEGEYLGEVVVSVEQVINNSITYGETWEEELTLCLIHGILHLLGYDDKNEKERAFMRKKEKEVLTFINTT